MAGLTMDIVSNTIPQNNADIQLSLCLCYEIDIMQLILYYISYSLIRRALINKCMAGL